ncbi:MAG TPA: hypothetical protein VN802_06110 [Stellaceae bacterium]|nr:hypothetical protein [Stellaceae bacterium]
MIVVRYVGWVLLLAAVVVLGRDLIAWHDSGVLAPVSLGELWLELHRASLVRIEDALAPWLLQMVRGTLSIPAAAGFLLVGIVLAWRGRNSVPRRRRPATRSPS